MNKKILIAVIILMLGIGVIVYLNYHADYKVTSTAGRDFTLLSPSWDIELKQATDCTNAKARNEDLQAITFDLTIKDADVSNFICELSIDGLTIESNSKRPYQIITSGKQFSIYQDHMVLFCCNKEGFPQQCDKRTLSKFCD